MLLLTFGRLHPISCVVRHRHLLHLRRSCFLPTTMDFLKSAVASIAKGPAFPYSFGDRVDIDQSIWTLHNGTRRVCDGLRDSHKTILS